MKNTFYVFSENNSLAQFMKSPEFTANAQIAESILFQIFSSQTDTSELESIIGIIKSDLPNAIIVGATTMGEILEGTLYKGKIVISISFFEKTSLKSISANCAPGSEFEIGKNMIKTIRGADSDIAGVLLLATPMSIDVSKVLMGISEEKSSFPIFGGGTGVYSSIEHSLIFCGNDFYNQGIVAVVFLGNELQINTKTFFGWNSLSKEMTITGTDGMLLKTVDDVCAFDIYRKYLNIQNDKDFFSYMHQFPFLLEKEGVLVSRVPYCVDDNGYMVFLADIAEGEKFHIGYSDPDSILQQSKAIQNDMSKFNPEVIFLYSSICRLHLLQKNIGRETKYFNHIAPTVGLFTYGEYFSYDSNMIHQNSAIVVVGMREGKDSKLETKPSQFGSSKSSDSVTAKQGVVSKLVHFIKTVSSELEQTSKELTKMASIDKLTQVLNRNKLDNILRSEISRSRRYNTSFSLILLDTDNFDQIIESLGQTIADNILVELARIIKKNIRGTDSVGRFDCSKFLIILPEINLEQACLAAEKIKAIICSSEFSTVEHITCSMGVTAYCENNDLDSLMLCVEKALETAKSKGTAKIVFSNIKENKE